MRKIILMCGYKVLLLVLITTFFYQFDTKGSAILSRTSMNENFVFPADTTVQNFWYDGKAEIATYDLIQPRYGENRVGHVVMVTVTEDFSIQKQVKLDNAMSDLEDVQKVLKNIFIRRFITGIYDYSLMTSTFIPFNPYFKESKEIYPIKITHSTQDWCGQSFTQLNNKNDRYIVETRSYYEIEADHVDNIVQTYAFDGFWSLARISPKKLPTGQFKLLPPLSELHLNHWTTKPLIVNAKLVKNEKYYSYLVESSNRQLRLSITIRKNLPFIIEEFYIEADGKRSTYKLRKLLRNAYWGLNHKRNEVEREKLDIPWLNK